MEQERPATWGECLESLRAEYDAWQPRRYRTVRVGKRNPVFPSIRDAVFARDRGVCRFCGASSGRLVLDHVVPWSAGGRDSSDNLRVLCWNCNSGRSNRSDPVQDRPLPVVAFCSRCYERRVGWPWDAVSGTPTEAWCETCEGRGTSVEEFAYGAGWFDDDVQES